MSDKKVKKGSTKEHHHVPTQTKYDKFLSENKKPWMWFNLMSTLGSIGLALGTFFIVYNSQYNCSYSDLKLTLWLVFAMHLVNTLETLLNLTGLERRLCNGPVVCVFFIFEITILVYMQVVYFES